MRFEFDQEERRSVKETGDVTSSGVTLHMLGSDTCRDAPLQGFGVRCVCVCV